MYGLGQGITLYKKNSGKWWKGVKNILQQIYEPLGRFGKTSPNNSKKGVIDIDDNGNRTWSLLNYADSHGGVFATILNIYSQHGITFGSGYDIDVDRMFERLNSKESPNMYDFFSEEGQYFYNVRFEDKISIAYTKDRGDANEKVAEKYLKTLWKNDTFEVMGSGDKRDIELGQDIIKTNKGGVETGFQVKPFKSVEIVDGQYRVNDVGSSRKYSENDVKSFVFVKGNDVILIKNIGVVENVMEKTYIFSKDVVIRDPQGILKRLDDEDGMVDNFIESGKI